MTRSLHLVDSCKMAMFQQQAKPQPPQDRIAQQPFRAALLGVFNCPHKVAIAQLHPGQAIQKRPRECTTIRFFRESSDFFDSIITKVSTELKRVTRDHQLAAPLATCLWKAREALTQHRSGFLLSANIQQSRARNESRSGLSCTHAPLWPSTGPPISNPD